MKLNLHKCLLTLNSLLSPLYMLSQSISDTVLAASKNYDRRSSYQRNWGSHYRQEWSAPVRFKIVMLDTLAGGLTPYESGGGRQSKSLRLRDKSGREYVLRSVDKSFGKALPEIFQGTFVESVINDQVSIANPYGILIVPVLAEAAGVYHTRPEIFFVPQQPALDSFNKDFANQLYMFEQRPDENWEVAANFGNSQNIIGTDKMLSELLEDNDHRVDQLSYVRARLFDFLIGDWGRHEDQWRWATVKKDDEKIYEPIPRDRDQAFTKFDGRLLKPAISMANLNHLQTFDKTIRDVNAFGFTARDLDRRLANEPSLKQWTEIAGDIQHALTNAVIEQAVKKLPAEVFTISGNELIEKLRSRRDHLVEYATTYYKFLAKDVDILGSDKKELFEINRISDNETDVKVYKIKKEGDVKNKPFYERKFYTAETNEIRLYGMGDDDIFHVTGTTHKGILIRIIGGNGNDSLTDSSSVGGSKKLTRVYDTDKTNFSTSGETRLHISGDSSINAYEYKSFEYDKQGFGVKPGFFSLTFGYDITKHQWRKEPVGSEHLLKLKYSINRQAVYIDYKTTFYQLLGKWNFFIGAGAGVPNVVNFFGVGNESRFENYDRRYYRLRSHDFYGKFGINRNLGKSQFIEAESFYQTFGIRQDITRFINAFKNDGGHNYGLERKHFTGAGLTYKYLHTDHPIIPAKGFRFLSNASYTHNLTTPGNSFAKFSSEAAVYIPVLKFISLAIRAGGATNLGDAEFYQLNQLGSHDNLRGYRKYRFYGKTSFYNNNEMRFMFNARNKVFNGRYGLIGFFDNGRVWHPGESSDTWHNGYGGGAFVSLFNKIVLSGTYGISKEDRVPTFYVGFYF
jgi:hypothetical protein